MVYSVQKCKEIFKFRSGVPSPEKYFDFFNEIFLFQSSSKCDNDDSFSTLKACIVHIIICIYYINAGQLRAAGWAVWLVVTARFAAA